MYDFYKKKSSEKMNKKLEDFGLEVREGVVNDIHEANLDFMKKVYDNAMFLADYLSWNKIQCNDGNKMRSIDDIHKEAYSLVKKKA